MKQYRQAITHKTVINRRRFAIAKLCDPETIDSNIRIRTSKNILNTNEDIAINVVLKDIPFTKNDVLKSLTSIILNDVFGEEMYF